jgi:hypothetical protein
MQKQGWEVDGLPSKHKALSSIPKRKGKEGREEGQRGEGQKEPGISG